MSSSKNNKSTGDNVNNAYKEFMPYWSKEEDCYKEATIIVDTTSRGGRVQHHTRSWPHAKSVPQIIYEGFMSKVKNPTNNEFFAERDKAGTPITQPAGQANCKYVIKTIVRLRKATGEEYLYSQGELQGFNSLGSPISTSINAPETWDKPLWLTERKFNQKNNTIEDNTKGIRGTEKVYELPFSKDNVNRLYENAVGVNGNQMRNGKKYDVSLVLKDEQSGIVQDVKRFSLERSLELFRDKDFDYLWNSEYIPEHEKRENRARSAGLLGGEENLPEIPRAEKEDNENFRQFTK